MPIVFTFDANGHSLTTNQRNRVQSFFGRFGWENLGGSAYRYPRLGTLDQPVEDWFNHVIPALMLFRTFALRNGISVTKFTIDAQSSTGWRPDSEYGSEIKSGTDMTLYGPTNNSFGQGQLREWLDGIEYPY